MTEFKLEQGVPIPKEVKRGPRAKYPFAQMQIGQSFHVEGKENFIRARKAAYLWGNSNVTRPHEFTAEIDDDGNGGRIWRKM